VKHTLETELTRLFSNPQRDVGSFKAPPQVQLAQDLGVPPATFKQWFHDFQALTGAHDWFRLREGVFVAF